MKDEVKTVVRPVDIMVEPEEKQTPRREVVKLVLEFVGMLVLALVVVGTLVYCVSHFWLGIV